MSFILFSRRVRTIKHTLGTFLVKAERRMRCTFQSSEKSMVCHLESWLRVLVYETRGGFSQFQAGGLPKTGVEAEERTWGRTTPSRAHGASTPWPIAPGCLIHRILHAQTLCHPMDPAFYTYSGRAYCVPLSPRSFCWELFAHQGFFKIHVHLWV